MSASAFFCEGIIRAPYRDVYSGPNRRTTSAKSTSALGGQTQGSTMARPPSVEEAVGGLAQQVAKLCLQRLGQVGVDDGRLQARMPEQELDDADIDAAREHVRGEAVAQRVGPEIEVEAASVTCLPESGPCGGIRQVGRRSLARKQPLPAAVGLPDLTE